MNVALYNRHNSYYELLNLIDTYNHDFVILSIIATTPVVKFLKQGYNPENGAPQVWFH